MRRYENAPVLLAIAFALAGLSSPMLRAEPGQSLASVVGSPGRPSEVFASTAGVTTLVPASEDPGVVLAAYRLALVDTYERHGRRNAAWDLAVTTGLGYLARAAAGDPDRPADAHDQAWHWLKHATDLGSDDPLVELLTARLAEGDALPQVARPRLETAREAVYRSAYASNLDMYERIVDAVLSRTTSTRLNGPCESVLPSYETFLTRYPDAVTERGEYVQALMTCERWKEASAQFEILTPERVRPHVFGGLAAYEHARLLTSVRARREARPRLFDARQR